MELTLLLQIIFIFIIFFINLVFVLLPLKIIPRDPSRLSSTKAKRIISFCNCFSGGVFLAVCFLQLTPYVNEKLKNVFQRTDSNPKFCLPTTQCVIMLGFFITQLAEQIVRKVQGSDDSHERPDVKMDSVQKVPTVKQVHNWIASSSSTDLGSESTASEANSLNGAPEKMRMLRSKRKRRKPRKAAAKEAKLASNSPAVLEPISFKVQDEELEMNSGHGHSHLPVMHGDDFGLHCVLLLLALSLHSFFEGIAIGLQDQVPKLLNLFLGVAVHECLVAFAVGISLAQQRLRLSTVLKLSCFFSLTIPIGIVIGMLIGTAHDSLGGQLASALVQAIAAGTFYHVIFLEILPTELKDSRDGLLKILFIFIGFSVITAMSFSISSHHH